MKNFIRYIKEFGFVFAIKYYFWSLLIKVSRKSQIKRNNVVCKYLNKHFKSLISENTKEENVESNNNIWVFWWTGLDTAPEIVRSCVQKMIKSSPNKKVVILDKNNIHNYVSIPQNVYDKIEKGYITITHFSDILRMILLSKYGGAWMDATIYYCGENIEEYLEKDFYTIKHENDNSVFVPKGRWTGYFLSCKKNNLLTTNVRNILYKYWEKHNLLIDYFLIDFLIDLVYSNCEKVQKMIDDVKFDNLNNEKLVGLMNQPFNEVVFNELRVNTNVFKLTWKKEFIKEVNGKQTFYDYIINQD